MRTVRDITVAVEPELYRQTRRIAAQYDTTVTNMVRFLLLTLPNAVEAARFPGGRPQFGRAAWLSAKAGTPWPPPVQPSSPARTSIARQNAEQQKPQNPPCTPVDSSQPSNISITSNENSVLKTAPAFQPQSIQPIRFQ